MHFPSDMTFQYFFLSTYVGYFLQALPIAFLVSLLYGVLRYRKDSTTPLGQKRFRCVFIAYVTGLICLVIGLDIMGIVWYRLLYQMDPGNAVGWFSGEFDFAVDFFHHINAEVVGNFLMFLPFGILHPLSKNRPTWKNTVSVGSLTVLLVELAQPIVGRAFDLNDIILNVLGILLSASVFFLVRKLFTRSVCKN